MKSALVVMEPLAISDIVPWDLAKLVHLGRLEMDLASTAFLSSLRRIAVIPISLMIASESTPLDVRSDPEDEIIAATRLVDNIPLLTRDQHILRSAVVPFAR